VRQFTCPTCPTVELLPWLGTSARLLCPNCHTIYYRQDLERAQAGPRPRRSTRAVADRQEKRGAKRLGARQTIASGQTPVDKADVRAADLRMECKSTEKASYVLKRETLDRVASQARDDEMPVLAIEFRGDRSAEYCVVSMDWFEQLLDAHRRERKC